jgi:hypothetical protein
MTSLTPRERKAARRAYVAGKAAALRAAPADRSAALDRARKALAYLGDVDRATVACEAAIVSGGIERLLAMLLATITVLARRLPEAERTVISKKLVLEGQMLEPETLKETLH